MNLGARPKDITFYPGENTFPVPSQFVTWRVYGITRRTS